MSGVHALAEENPRTLEVSRTANACERRSLHSDPWQEQHPTHAVKASTHLLVDGGLTLAQVLRNGRHNASRVVGEGVPVGFRMSAAVARSDT